MPKTWTSVDVLSKTHKNVDDVKDAEGKDGRRIHGRRIKALVDAEDRTRFAVGKPRHRSR